MEEAVEQAALLTYDAKIRSGDRTSTSSLERMLWDQVQIIDDKDSCWPWTGSQYKERNGERTYGRFAIPAAAMTDGRRLITTAPRSVFWFACGYWPVAARHKCDNPPCCRPRHLENGTHADNVRDRVERGRSRNRPFPAGELNPVAALTEDMVIASRILYRASFSFLRISAMIGRTESAVRQAACGETWAHIIVPPPIAPGEVKSPGGKLTRAQIDEIRKLRAEGARPRDIAWQFGVTPSNVTYLTRDMRNPRPTTRRGERFTDDEVRAIRRARDEADLTYEKLASLAARYGITAVTASKIARRHLYAHVPDEAPA
jgi:hypothetical protein